MIAEAFAAQKSAIAVTGRDKKAGKEAADGLLKRGAKAIFAPLGVIDESWDHNMDVNAKGTFIMSQLGAPFLAHYCVSKFAVIGFSQGLALEVAEHGIRVNAVCPIYTHTGMQERELRRPQSIPPDLP